MTEYLVPFEISILDYLTVEADTPGIAVTKVKSHLLSHKDEWCKLDYALAVEAPVPVEPEQVANVYQVIEYSYSGRASERHLIRYYALHPWADNYRFNHALVVETSQGDPAAIAWIDVQLDDGNNGESIIGWVHFRVLPEFEADADTILLQCVDCWAEDEPQLHLFASYTVISEVAFVEALRRLGWKHAGMAPSCAATEHQPGFIMCHRSGDQALALEMARLRA